MTNHENDQIKTERNIEVSPVRARMEAAGRGRAHLSEVQIGLVGRSEMTCFYCTGSGSKDLICSRCVGTLKILDARARGVNEASRIVREAVQEKRLPKPSSRRCDDCEKRAELYDHRDYNKPLKVAPVCFSCNRRRGPGIPVKNYVRSETLQLLQDGKIRVLSYDGPFFKGDVLKSMRESKNKTLLEMAEKIGCDESTISMWENNKRRPSPRGLRGIAEFFKVPISTFFVFIFLFLIAAPAKAEVDRDAAIRTIVGEAANQGPDGMTAVGEVIRNRYKKGLKPSNGFYGYGAMKKRFEPAWVWKRAAQAWDRSATTKLTSGATLMENIAAFGFPKSWDREKVVCVAHIKDHWFFVEE